MEEHRDILEERESLKRPFAGSVVFHVLLFTTVAVVSVARARQGPLLGTPDPGAGSVLVTATASLPVAARSGIRNPLANDSESPVPEKIDKKDAKRKAPEPEPDAIPIPARGKPDKSKSKQTTQTAKIERPERPSQVYANTPQAISSPMYGGKAGGGGVGLGENSPFGSQFGWYAQLVQQRIASKWRTDTIDARLDSAPAATVTFTISRDGSTRDVRVVQSSGTYTVDTSAQRAVIESSPFPPLPPGFNRDSAQVEIVFRFKR